MIPKLTVFFSKTLVMNIIRENVEDPRMKEFFGETEAFRKELKKSDKKLLKTITEVVGVEFEEKDINIYVVPAYYKLPSIPYPLILKIRKDQKLNVQFLIHELTHRILNFNMKMVKHKQYFYPKIIGIAKHEALTDTITREVTRRLFGAKKSKELTEKEQKIITSRNVIECEKYVKEFQEMYDLKNKSLVKCFDEVKIK